MIGDVHWTTPGRNSLDSLPLGNGDIAANVWTEPSGDIALYLAKNDAWDHLGRLVKIGRVRLSCTPHLLAGETFEQKLSLADASISLTNGRTTVRLWCDAHHPRLIIECESDGPVDLQVSLDRWREEPRELRGREIHAATGLEDGPVPLITQADQPVDDLPDAVAWYQRNTASIWGAVLDHQGSGELKEHQQDPLLHRTFGAHMAGPLFQRIDARTLRASQVTTARIIITVRCEQVGSATEWLEHILAQASAGNITPLADAWRKHCDWWAEFWSRSHINLEARGPDWGNAESITRHANWHRYLVACCGRGEYPVKFNGGLFTADWQLPEESFDADYRRWGGGYWWQNTRLIYWSLLASGDYDLLRPLFRMYGAMLPLAEQRTRAWFGHDGAFFPETLYFWGTYLPSNYGWDRTGKPLSHVDNRYIRSYWQGGLELVALMLETYRHTADPLLLREQLLPVARAVLRFYVEHYPLDAAGKLHLSPTQSLETWWEAENPTPELAALHSLLPALLDLPAADLQPADRESWRQLQTRVPALPLAQVDGRTLLRAAERHEDVAKNSENPELYAVFPYRVLGVGRPALETGQWTFTRRMFPDTGGWRQDAVHAALLGLTETAAFYVTKNCNDGNVTPARFKGFWGPNYDWVPDFDHGSVSRLALQAMLVQTVGPRIYLFPAWPAERWNVSFKLHLPARTVIEAELRDGKLTRLEVTPSERRTDIVVMLGQSATQAQDLPPTYAP